MTRVIGIDPSMTSAGVAFIDFGLSGFSATTFCAQSAPVKRKKGESTKQTLDERYARLTCLVTEVLDPAHLVKPALAVIEEPLYGTPGGASFDRAGLWWLLVSRLLRLDVPVAQVNVTTRRMWATGNRAAGKGSVSATMARMWPDVPPETEDDEWDALVFATMGAQFLGLLPVELVRHREQLDKVTWPAMVAEVGV